jgi:tetratricopeptide (TPR) repeat protein
MTVETQVNTEPECVRCGTRLPEGSYWCAACGKLNASPAARLIFVVILVAILAGSGFTRWYVGYLRNLQTSLAARWFSRGEDAMAKKYPAVAIEDYRNALGYDSKNPEYRLKLAEALQADGRRKEAGAYLLGLWSQEPANAQVNLDLARLYARHQEVAKAVRYYRAAIDGVWSGDPLQRRLAARFEFVEYLLSLGNRNNALAELIALQSEIPPDDVSSQMRAGQLLLQLGEYSRAQRTFEALLKEHPEVREAWSAAGKAALDAGDTREAERLLTKAVSLSSEKKGGPEAGDLLLAREVLAVDPNLRTLTLAERSRRAASAFEFAMNRLTSCASRQGTVLLPTAAITSQPITGAQPNAAAGKAQNGLATPVPTAPAPGSLQLLYDSGLQRRASATAESLKQNPDAIAPTMEFVYQVTRATESTCSAQSLQDRALQVLAGHDAREQR